MRMKRLGVAIGIFSLVTASIMALGYSNPSYQYRTSINYDMRRITKVSNLVYNYEINDTAEDWFPMVNGTMIYFSDGTTVLLEYPKCPNCGERMYVSTITGEITIELLCHNHDCSPVYVAFP
jgi:hypothetical protein